MALTQKEAILDYLQIEQSITPLQALMQFGCFRLGARIHELRGQGHIIDTEYTTDSHGKSYARYRYRHRSRQQLSDTRIV